MNISAFKLFFDEFVYKENVMVSYSKIKEIIDNIRELALKIRNTYKGDIEEYNKVLNEVHLELKNELNKIKEVEPYLFEVYYVVYKNKVTIGTDSVLEMPFIIATSFYEDYRIDNKDDHDGKKKNLIPRFTSLEKRKMKNDYKNMGLGNYFIYLLSNTPNNYDFCIKAINEMNDVRPLYDEKHYDYLMRTNNLILDFEEVIDKTFKKAQKSIDFEIINDSLEFVLKRKITSWKELFATYYKDYYNDIYEEAKNNKSLLFEMLVANDMPFDTFEEFCTELVLEKERLYDDFKNKKVLNISIDDKSYCASFRRKMIDEYFDERLNEEFSSNDDESQIAVYSYHLASLGVDLEDRIFNRILYEASHSPSLKRNNDVRNAIINKIYDLYNPYYLLPIYEKKRKELEVFLKDKGRDFELNVNIEMKKMNERANQNFEIKSERQIKNSLIERKKEFLLEHYMDVKSQDIFDYYDTRDYDLSIICQGLSLNDLVNVYNLTKYEIKNNDSRKSSCIIREYDKLNDHKKWLLQNVLEFYASEILKIVNKNKILDKELYNSLLKDTAKKYLGEEFNINKVLGNCKKDLEDNMNRYYVKKEEFYKESKFYELISALDKLKKNR